MKVMMLVHETTRPSEPPPEIFAAIEAIGERETAAGTLLDSGGLLPIEQGGSILRLAGGTISTTDGPFAEARELVGGWSVYEVDDMKAANEKAETFLDVSREHWPGWEGWVEVRPLLG